MLVFNFDRRLAVVTGASRGIGKAIASALLESNANVIGTYASDEVAAKQCRVELAPFGERFLLIKNDVSRREDVIRIFDHATERFGQSIQMLVNNAGVLKQGDFLELTDTDWDQAFDVNMKGPFMLSQELLRSRRQVNAGPASIVNISSVGGQTGGNKAPDYAATKAALISLTRSLARIGAQCLVRSNAVAPGWIQTDIFSAEQLESLQSEARKVIPLERMGQPAEVAMAVLFLLSDASSYITGHCINANGGMYFG
jgi:NAD(P)-dependent dehydrogenase (short-subunit alcohol dehydrogenase family)